MLFIKDQKGNLWNVAVIESFVKVKDYYFAYLTSSTDNPEDQPRFDKGEVQKVLNASLNTLRNAKKADS
jgi:hypothetical protein